MNSRKAAALRPLPAPPPMSSEDALPPKDGGAPIVWSRSQSAGEASQINLIPVKGSEEGDISQTSSKGAGGI